MTARQQNCENNRVHSGSLGYWLLDWGDRTCFVDSSRRLCTQDGPALLSFTQCSCHCICLLIWLALLWQEGPQNKVAQVEFSRVRLLSKKYEGPVSISSSFLSSRLQFGGHVFPTSGSSMAAHVFSPPLSGMRKHHTRQLDPGTWALRLGLAPRMGSENHCFGREILVSSVSQVNQASPSWKESGWTIPQVKRLVSIMVSTVSWLATWGYLHWAFLS